MLHSTTGGLEEDHLDLITKDSIVVPVQITFHISKLNDMHISHL